MTRIVSDSESVASMVTFTWMPRKMLVIGLNVSQQTLRIRQRYSVDPLVYASCSRVPQRAAQRRLCLPRPEPRAEVTTSLGRSATTIAPWLNK